MNNKLLLGLAVVLVGLGVGWYVLKGVGFIGAPTTATPTPTETIAPASEETTEAVGTTGAEGVMEQVTVSYTDNGFTPVTLTVKLRTTVKFVNESTSQMWVASAVHPTHQLLPGFDQLTSVGKGGSYEYTFTKVGTWKYHNHVNPSDTGSVMVTE